MSISDVITIVGIPALFGTLVYMGRQLQILSHLTVTVEKMKLNIKVIADALVKSDVPFIGDELESYSPLRVTEEGIEYLEKVGFIDVFSKN
ncbi:MAG: hypothetical protein KAS32_06850 [Candidatus Peribacteraceae bacterium]|nr:hypothetical protein [Candidatus Peribacteraceae bacterium]